MRALLFLMLLPLSPLLADKITTNESKSFEGVVTAFDKDKKLTLATGYGDLSFTVASEVKDAAVTEYEWPKTASAAKPARDSKFESWVQERNANSRPKDWAAVPTTTETDELDAAKTTEALKELQEINQGDGSPKEKREARKKVTELLKDKWFYIQLPVTSAAENGKLLRIDISSEPFDARTGKKLGNYVYSHPAVYADPSMDAHAVDKQNAATAKRVAEERAAGSSPSNIELYIDYSTAENLVAGDGVVFKVSVSLDSEGLEVWTLTAVRAKPQVKAQR